MPFNEKSAAVFLIQCVLKAGLMKFLKGEVEHCYLRDFYAWSKREKKLKSFAHIGEPQKKSAAV